MLRLGASNLHWPTKEYSSNRKSKYFSPETVSWNSDRNLDTLLEVHTVIVWSVKNYFPVVLMIKGRHKWSRIGTSLTRFKFGRSVGRRGRGTWPLWLNNCPGPQPPAPLTTFSFSNAVLDLLSCQERYHTLKPSSLRRHGQRQRRWSTNRSGYQVTEYPPEHWRAGVAIPMISGEWNPLILFTTWPPKMSTIFFALVSVSNDSNHNIVSSISLHGASDLLKVDSPLITNLQQEMCWKTIVTASTICLVQTSSFLPRCG